MDASGNEFYAPDLALVHDHDFAAIAEAAAAEILAQATAQFGRAVRILDLGCGSGTTAARLSAAGHTVTGVDYSQAMVDLARKNAPKAKFVCASLFDFALPQVEVITAISEAVNYLVDARSSIDNLRELFGRIYAALPKNGLFIFDALTTAVADYAAPRKAITENERWSMFLHVHVDPQTDQLTREITLFTKTGDQYRRSKEVHRQQLYTVPQLQEVLDSVGFSAEIRHGYAELEFRQGLVGFICRK